MNLTRKFLTTLIITLALCGVQVVQASALHDHSAHFTGCALCHFDGANAIQPASTVQVWVPEVIADTFIVTIAAPVTGQYPAFHERAPPRFSS